MAVGDDRLGISGHEQLTLHESMLVLERLERDGDTALVSVVVGRENIGQTVGDQGPRAFPRVRGMKRVVASTCITAPAAFHRLTNVGVQQE